MNILLIGESCVDKYVYGECDRICQEAPIPIFTKNGKEEICGGMSQNVFNNLISLSSKKLNIDHITNGSLDTIAKTRYVDEKHGRIVFREDKECRCTPLEFDDIPQKDYDAIIVSDYDKGLITNNLLFHFSKFHCLKIIDTKKRLENWKYYFNFIKLNEEESEKNKDLIFPTDKTKYIITKGKNGCSYISPGYKMDFNPEKVNELNPSGAGDVFVCGFAVYYLENLNTIKDKERLVYESIRFALVASAECVSRSSTTVVKRDWVKYETLPF